MRGRQTHLKITHMCIGKTETGQRKRDAHLQTNHNKSHAPNTFMLQQRSSVHVCCSPGWGRVCPGRAAWPGAGPGSESRPCRCMLSRCCCCWSCCICRSCCWKTSCWAASCCCCCCCYRKEEEEEEERSKRGAQRKGVGVKITELTAERRRSAICGVCPCSLVSAVTLAIPLLLLLFYSGLISPTKSPLLFFGLYHNDAAFLSPRVRAHTQKINSDRAALQPDCGL